MIDPYADHADGVGAGRAHAIVRTFTGAVLLVMGLGVVIWLITSLGGLLAGESVPRLVAAVTPEADEPVTLGLPEGQFTLPAALFVPIGYLLVCFAYAIAGTLAAILINGGTSLMQPDTSKLLRRLVERLEHK